MQLQISKFERLPWLRILLPLLAALIVASASHTASHAAAAPERVYVISNDDGYGLNDCITQKRACGRIVADAWCESHGHGRSIAFGAASDLTGAIDAKAQTPSPAADAALVSCAE
jgi:hypothetical protein